jgi:hypothetical protein
MTQSRLPRSAFVDDKGFLTRAAESFLLRTFNSGFSTTEESDTQLFLDIATTQEIAKDLAAQREDYAAAHHARLSEAEKAIAAAQDVSVPTLAAQVAELRKQVEDLTALVSMIPNLGPLLEETRKKYARLDTPVNVTGSRADPEEALANTLNALDSLGLINDSTTI